MDVLTEKGQRTVQQEARAVEIWHSHYPNLRYVHTPKDLPAKADAVIVKDDQIEAVVETKCRNFSLSKLASWYDNEFLVTARKIDECIFIAKELCVPLVLFVYLVPSDVLMVIKITDASGEMVCHARKDLIRVQATVNGGDAHRECYFIGAQECTILSR